MRSSRVYQQLKPGQTQFAAPLDDEDSCPKEVPEGRQVPIVKYYTTMPAASRSFNPLVAGSNPARPTKIQAKTPTFTGWRFCFLVHFWSTSQLHPPSSSTSLLICTEN
jgi:hypothetical protein